MKDANVKIRLDYLERSKKSIESIDIASILRKDFEDYLINQKGFPVPIKEGDEYHLYFKHKSVSGDSNLIIGVYSKREFCLKIHTRLSFTNKGERDESDMVSAFEMVYNYKPNFSKLEE